MPLFLDIEKKLPGFTLSMQLETGDETTALLGASGSGKSMTLRCIAGVDRPDRGRIVLNGQVLFDSARHIPPAPAAQSGAHVPALCPVSPHERVPEPPVRGAPIPKGCRTEPGRL